MLGRYGWGQILADMGGDKSIIDSEENQQLLQEMIALLDKTP